MKTIAILITLILSGCATPNVGAVFNKSSVPISADAGTAVFYRTEQNAFAHGPAWSRFSIAIDGEKTTAIGENTFAAVQLPAGAHELNAMTANIDTVEKVNIQPGHIYYFHVYPVGYSFFKAILIKETPETEAMSCLQSLREQINKEPWIKKVVVSKPSSP